MLLVRGLWYLGSYRCLYVQCCIIITLRPRQNRLHFADDIFKCIFLKENIWISLKISVECVPDVRININPALVQIMAWRQPGGKPLSEPMMASLLTHISVTLPQWVIHVLSTYMIYKIYTIKLQAFWSDLNALCLITKLLLHVHQMYCCLCIC